MSSIIDDIISIEDHDLEMEFKSNFFSLNSEAKAKIRDLFMTTADPTPVGTYNSGFGGCCCTIQSSSVVCGGSGFLPTAVECTPGGA